jgi:hypothetical protein
MLFSYQTAWVTFQNTLIFLKLFLLKKLWNITNKQKAWRSTNALDLHSSVLGLNLSRDTGYPVWGVSSLNLLEIFQDSTSTRPRPLPSNIFPIRGSCIILLFCVMGIVMGVNFRSSHALRPRLGQLGVPFFREALSSALEGSDHLARAGHWQSVWPHFLSAALPEGPATCRRHLDVSTDRVADVSQGGTHLFVPRSAWAGEIPRSWQQNIRKVGGSALELFQRYFVFFAVPRLPLPSLLCRTYLPLACAIFRYAHRHHVFHLHFAGDNSERERTVFLVDQSGVDTHCCVYCCWCSASSCSIGLICSPGMTKLCLISLLHTVPSEGKHSTYGMLAWRHF